MGARGSNKDISLSVVFVTLLLAVALVGAGCSSEGKKSPKSGDPGGETSGAVLGDLFSGTGLAHGQGASTEAAGGLEKAFNAPPTIQALADPAVGIAPLSVVLTATVHDPENEQVQVVWDLGDDETAEGVQLAHTFDEAGEYEVLVTATDEADNTATDSLTVTVADPQDVIVMILASPMSGPVPLDVSFSLITENLPGEVVSASWQLGNGESSEGLEAAASYNTAGEHAVTVEVVDSTSASYTAATTVEVDMVPGDLTPLHANTFPSRITQGGPANVIAVSDAPLGSVFLYDTELEVTGEIKNIDLPLGVAISPEGNIYVGSNGNDRIEVYTADGELYMVVAGNGIQMPNDMAFGPDGNLYVVDSEADTVKVFTPAGAWLGDIGGPGDEETGLAFPAALTIRPATEDSGALVYVADQQHNLVRAFDLDGELVHSFGGQAVAFSTDWEGLFARVQSLAIDGAGNLHALDNHLNAIQVFDLPDGNYLEYYGSFGLEPGELNLPLDIHVDGDDQVIVTNAGNSRLEVF
jgi:PKD repeat protein